MLFVASLLSMQQWSCACVLGRVAFSFLNFKPKAVPESRSGKVGCLPLCFVSCRLWLLLCSFISLFLCPCRTHSREGVPERGVFAFTCQYIISLRGRTGNPLLFAGQPNCARQSLVSTVLAPRVATTSYCHPVATQMFLKRSRLRLVRVGVLKRNVLKRVC